MNDDGKAFRRAMRLLDDGDAAGALVIGEALLASDGEADRVSGLLCFGAVYESGGRDVPIDFDRAIGFYRRAAFTGAVSIPFMDIARVQLKRGGPDAKRQALASLREYSAHGETSQYFCGLAMCAERTPDASPAEAMALYRRAALKLRFEGFFGYARVARGEGLWGRALLCDVLRVAFGIPMALLTRGRASAELFWY
jgi:hypothetical protein